MKKDENYPVVNTCTTKTVLENDEEYRTALAKLSQMFDSNIEDEKAFLDLAEIVEEYEKKHFPIPEPEGNDAMDSW